MSRQKPVELDIPPGVFSEETDRGTKGRYKDCDRIRFREAMPEKIGGWILSSVGETDSEQVNFEYIVNGSPQPVRRAPKANATYAAAAASITLDAQIGQTAEGVVHDGDPVWLFDDSLTGGMGAITVTGTKGNYNATASANVTATRGDAVFVRFPSEFASADGATIVDGSASGSVLLTLGTAVNTYIDAGSIVRVKLLNGDDFHTRLEYNILAGATQITLEDALPSAALSGIAAVQLYPKGSHLIRLETTVNVAYVIFFLANSPAASTALLFTRPLPASVTAAQLDIRPFQETFADGEHVATTTLNISPVTAFGIASTGGSTISNGLVYLPEWERQFTRYIGQVRAVHDWKDLSDQQWAAIGTDKKLYVINEGQLFDITPLRSSAILIDPFTTTNGSMTVTVTDVAHGAQVGDYVRFSGSTTVGGINMDGEFLIVTVIDADNYTVTHPEFATANAVGGGTVDVEYDLSAGLEDTDEVGGWGTGPFGGGPYGVGEAGTGVQQKLRIWSLDNFGEDLLASPSGGALYHWDRSAGPTTRAVVVPTAPATIQRMLVSPQARHVIALGAGTGDYTAPGPPDSLFIRWSSSEDFSDWLPTTTNTASDLRLDKGSEIITAVESRGEIIINTDESLHALQYIGGEFIFGLRHLGQSVSVIGPNAEVDVNGIVMFMADDDFIMYDGVIRVMPCSVHETVFGNINTQQGYKVFACVMRQFNEVWWFYVSAAGDEPDRYAKYNYLLQAWDFGSMNRTAFHDKSRFLGAPYGFDQGLMWQHETGTDETDTDGILRPMVAFIESGDIEIDSAGSVNSHVHALIPDFKILAGEIELRVSGKPDPQDSAHEVIRGPFVVTSTTKRVPGARLKSRQIAFSVRSDKLGDNWRMGKWKAEIKPKNRRGAV